MRGRAAAIAGAFGLVVGAAFVARAQTAADLTIPPGESRTVACESTPISVATVDVQTVTAACEAATTTTQAPTTTLPPTTTTEAPTTTQAPTTTTQPPAPFGVGQTVPKVTGTGTLTTGLFSVPAGSKVLAFVAYDSTAAGSNPHTINGCGLVWSLDERVSVQPSGVEVWWADAAAAAGPCSVASSETQTAMNSLLEVVTFTGAATGAPTSVTSSFNGALPSVNLTTAAGSLLYAVSSDWNARTGTATFNSGTSLVAEHRVTSFYNGWVYQRSGGGTIGMMAPTSQRGNIAAVEVRPASAPPPATTTTQASTTTVPPTTTTAPGGGVVVGTGPGAMVFPEAPGLTGTPLTAYTGPRSFTSGTHVFQNCDVTGGTLTVDGSANVTFRNCKFRLDGWRQILQEGGVVTLEHVLLDGSLQNNEPAFHMGGGSATLRYVQCINVANCFRLTNALAEWNQINIAGYNAPGTDAHSDGIELSGGTSSATVRNNHINIAGAEGQTGAINVTTDFGNISNVTIQNNTLMGGTYSLYLRGDGFCSCGSLSNIRVIGNRWQDTASTPLFGQVSYFPRQGLVEWTNNIHYFTNGSSQTVPAP